MPEALMTEEGQALDLDAGERDFARAMAAPEPSEQQAPAPPKRVTDPEAPFGRKLDGTPKKTPGGRRPAKPRVTDARPDPAQARGKAPVTLADYTGPLGDFTSAVWMVLAAAPAPGEPLRLKLRAQAKVLRQNQPGLCQGVNLMAQHNGTIRRGVEALTMGSAGWVLPAVMAMAPFAVQSAALWKSDPADLADMAAETEAEWAGQFAAMRAEMGLDQAEETAEDIQREREFYAQHTDHGPDLEGS